MTEVAQVQAHLHSQRPDAPRILRVRHELKRRTLRVLRVERPAQQLVRVVLGGPELAGFTSLGFDDHVKLFFPSQGGGDAQAAAGTAGATAAHDQAGAAGQYAMRDFTPRLHDAVRGELWIEFFLHAAGPAAAWAAQAAVGQSLVVGGPKGSALICFEGIDSHVLIGDETALPAIHRRLGELPASARALVVVETDAGVYWPAPASRATAEVLWVARGGAGAPAHDIIETLRGLELPRARCFFWVAAETQVARAIRRYLHGERAVGKEWIKAAGYWRLGAVGAHDKITDE